LVEDNLSFFSFYDFAFDFKKAWFFKSMNLKNYQWTLSVSGFMSFFEALRNYLPVSSKLLFVWASLSGHATSVIPAHGSYIVCVCVWLSVWLGGRGRERERMMERRKGGGRKER
jgi:hypothetical protein